MGLSFNFISLVPLILMIGVLLSLWYKEWKLAAFFVFVGIFSAVFMPVKLTQQNMRVHEDTSRFDNPPPKVDVKTEFYETFSNKELLKLKQESNNETP